MLVNMMMSECVDDFRLLNSSTSRFNNVNEDVKLVRVVVGRPAAAVIDECRRASLRRPTKHLPAGPRNREAGGSRARAVAAFFCVVAGRVDGRPAPTTTSADGQSVARSSARPLARTGLVVGVAAVARSAVARRGPRTACFRSFDGRLASSSSSPSPPPSPPLPDATTDSKKGGCPSSSLMPSSSSPPSRLTSRVVARAHRDS